MESMLLKSIFIVFTTVHVRSLTPGPGVCEKPSRYVIFFSKRYPFSNESRLIQYKYDVSWL